MNIAFLISGLLTNNIVSLLISVVFLGYNYYSQKKNLRDIYLIIDDRETNVKNSNKISLIYKIKMVIYTLVSIYAMVIGVFSFFEKEKYLNKLRIININI